MATPLRIQGMERGRKERQEGKNKEVNNKVNVNFCSVRNAVHKVSSHREKNGKKILDEAIWLSYGQCNHATTWYHGFKYLGCHPSGVSHHGADCSSLEARLAVEPRAGWKDSPVSLIVPQLWSRWLNYLAMLCWWSATAFGGFCREIDQMALPGGSVTCWMQCERSWRVPPRPHQHRGMASVLSAWKPILASFPAHLSSVDEEHWTAAGYYFQTSSMIICTTYNEINFELFFLSNHCDSVL